MSSSDKVIGVSTFKTTLARDIILTCMADRVRYKQSRVLYINGGVCCFRAEIITGGFVVKELSSDPPSYVVTYMTRVDLKGK